MMKGICKKKLYSRIFILFTAFSIAMSALGGISFAAENSGNYAEIVFDKKITTKNLTYMPETFSWTPETRDGVTGRRSAHYTKGDGSVLLNLADGVMYNLPPGTPVDITIKYFDDDLGKFSIHYDSHKPMPNWNYDPNNTVWQKADDVKMENSQTWKTVKVHLEDLRAANRLNYGCDIRISTWDPLTGSSAKDVLIHSIRVEVSDFITPLEGNIGLEQYGNIAGPDEVINFTADARNKLDEELAVDWEINVYDEKGNLLDTKTLSYVMEAKEASVNKVKLINPVKYGFYKMTGRLKAHSVTNPERSYDYTYNTEFTISPTFDVSQSSDNFGSLNHYSKNRGDTVKTSEILRRAGMTITRDDIGGGVFKDGRWYANPELKEKWKYLAEQGHDILAMTTSDGIKSAWNMPPNTKEQLDAYELWCEGIARDLKGIVKYFEVWNEYNLKSYNEKGATAADYAEMCKRAYKGFKKGNPDAVVVGLDTAHIPLDFIEEVFEAGGYDYMDIISVHPYDWSGAFDADNLINNCNKLKELMMRYGELKPVWISEYGLFTMNEDATGSHWVGNDGHTFESQYQYWVLSRAVNDAYGLYDRFIAYCTHDFWPMDNTLYDFGFINVWEKSGDKTPFGAKPSYLGMAAYNLFVNRNTEATGKIRDGNFFALKFHNRDLDKDVLLIQDNGGESFKSLDLGCDTVTMYDGYGNQQAVLKSNNGVFGFSASLEPVWIVGNFKEFKEVKDGAAVEAPLTHISAVENDIAKVTFKKNISKKLNVNIEGIEKSGNGSFVGNKAEIKIPVMQKTGEKSDFYITISDDKGNVYYKYRYRISVVEPVMMNFTTEVASDNNVNRWRVRTEITNPANYSYISGTVRITSPESFVKASTSRRFERIAPGETRTLMINLPERLLQQVEDVELGCVLDTGVETSAVKQSTFSVAKYAHKKPIIDGNVNSGEWTGSWFGSEQERFVHGINDWGGPSDISFSMNTMWDEENFYLACVVTDDIHCMDYTPADVFHMYLGDSVQFALNDEEFLNPANFGSFMEFSIGKVNDVGPSMWRNMSMNNTPTGEVKGQKLEIKRHDTYTVYELCMPWDLLFGEGYVLNSDKRMRFSALVNDNDDGNRGYVEYMSGIASVKSAGQFGLIEFAK